MANNILQQVATYQMSSLAALVNQMCFVSTANTKFKNFQNLTANLGSTVNFDKQPRMYANDGLVAQFGGVEQRIQSLTINNAKSVSFDFTAQEFLFNVKDYMDVFGKAAVAELASVIEGNVASIIPEETYLFSGTPSQPIDSYEKLANSLAFQRDFGAPKDDMKVYLPTLIEPKIIGQGLTQFALNRNNEDANSWEIGNFGGVNYYRSNLLPVHKAGTIGNTNTTLTLVSFNQVPGGTQLTFSGAAVSDANAIKKNDKLQFNDGVAGKPNIRFRTWTGHQVSGNPVQCRIVQDAASDGSGNVTVTVYPALISDEGRNQNLSVPLEAGMQVQILSDHREGLLCSGNALFVAMPVLPEEYPYPTSNQYDPDSGIGIRMYYGSVFGQNQRGMVYDAIWGKTLVPEYSRALIFAP